MKSPVEEALAGLTRARTIDIWFGESRTPERYIGHLMFSNDNYLIVNGEDGRKVFLRHALVTRIVETPLG